MPKTTKSTGRSETLRIGELARLAETSADTVRYYERLGLLGAAGRSASGYRFYNHTDLGRLQFIRRAKVMGLSLNEIRDLLGLAEEGECQPLRRHVAQLLRQKIEECEAKIAELIAFKADLEERQQVAIRHQHDPGCGCQNFPESCACLPVKIGELNLVGANMTGPHNMRKAYPPNTVGKR